MNKTSIRRERAYLTTENGLHVRFNRVFGILDTRYFDIEFLLVKKKRDNIVNGAL